MNKASSAKSLKVPLDVRATAAVLERTKSITGQQKTLLHHRHRLLKTISTEKLQEIVTPNVQPIEQTGINVYKNMVPNTQAKVKVGSPSPKNKLVKLLKKKGVKAQNEIKPIKLPALAPCPGLAPSLRVKPSMLKYFSEK